MTKLCSVVIPCRNEVRTIQSCVETILKSTYSNLEVIIVDGMSTDGTRDVLSSLSQKYGNVHFIDNAEQLTPFAFNIGIKAAKGDYIQIAGSRNILDHDYIEKLVSVLNSKPDVACTGGNYRHQYNTTAGKYISWAMESKFGVGASNYRTMTKSCYVDTVGVPMFRKSIFDEIGFFDEELTRNQDDEFSHRLTKTGHKIYYCADTSALYYVRDSYQKAFNQMMQYGYFKVFVNKKHKTVTTKRQLIPALFLLFLITFGALSFFDSLAFAFYILILALYWTLGLASAIRFTKNPKEILLVQWAILNLHIGYGYGYLKGILDFLLLNKKPSCNMQKQTT